MPSTQSRRMDELSRRFRAAFGIPPLFRGAAHAQVPIAGHVTLPHKGLLLSMPLDRAIRVAVVPRSDGRIALATGDAPPENFPITNLDTDSHSAHCKAIVDLLRRLQARRVHFQGLSLACVSDLPGFAVEDLGSAILLSAATLRALRQLYPFTLGPLGAAEPPRPDYRGQLPLPRPEEYRHWAMLCVQAAGVSEHHLAQALAALHGRSWALSAVDCLEGSVQSIPFPAVVAVLCPVPTPPEPPDLAVHGRAASAALGGRALRSAQTADLEEQRALLSPLQYASARFLLEEIALTAAAERALHDQDSGQFGQYIEQTAPWMNAGPAAQLKNIARAHPACLGTSLRPGYACHLVKHHLAPAFVAYLEQTFRAATGLSISPVLCSQ